MKYEEFFKGEDVQSIIDKATFKFKADVVALLEEEALTKEEILSKTDILNYNELHKLFPLGANYMVKIGYIESTIPDLINIDSYKEFLFDNLDQISLLEEIEDGEPVHIINKSFNDKVYYGLMEYKNKNYRR